MLNNLTILDFETTGLNPEHDFVTEIGALRVREGIVTGQFQTFVNFGGLVPAKISELTGISQADVDAGFANQPAEGRPHTSYYKWIPAVAAEGKEVRRG